MKTIKFIAAISCMLMCRNGFTQQPSQFRFTSLIQAGVIYGQSTSAFHGQVIGGAKYGTWSVGAGIGLDEYYFRSVPVFIDIRKNILNRERSPYVFIDLGVNFPWLKNKEKLTWQESDYSRGFYSNMGIGYQLPISKKIKFNVGLGYSRKILNETRTYRAVFDPLPPTPPNIEMFTYRLNRISFNTGLSF